MNMFKSIIVLLVALTVTACGDPRDTKENIRFAQNTKIIIDDTWHGSMWMDCYNHDTQCRVGIGGYGSRTVNPETIKVRK